MNAPSYGWIITADKICGEDKPDVGVAGPRGLSDADTTRLNAGEGVAFRMKDDDGILYYEGRFLGDEKSEEAFGPLDDFGMPNAGCTSIEYKNARGGWEAL